MPNNHFAVCVIDVGSPRLGNIGWAFIDNDSQIMQSGTNLDDMFPHIFHALGRGSVWLGLEAPLFVPIRDDLMLATKARKGEERRPWSAGAGAQVLAMNLPIMIYIFKKIYSQYSSLAIALNPEKLEGKKQELLIFEAIVSGKDKGNSHEEDASIMAYYCFNQLMNNQAIINFLGDEDSVDYFNLAACALNYAGFSIDQKLISEPCQIIKPSTSADF